MNPFRIYSKGRLIGHTEFENGDPPMGVAFGRLFPTEHYAVIQKELISNPSGQTHLALSAETPDGRPFKCVSVVIDDYSSDLGPEEIQVSALGINDPPYAELFPHHVALYEQQFPLAP
jgi:hypothetical protein